MIRDDYGRVIFDEDDMSKFMLGDNFSPDVFVEENVASSYNELCSRMNKEEYSFKVITPIPHSPEQEHQNRCLIWHIPDHYREFDLWKYLEDKCKDQTERDRLSEEKIYYLALDLEMVLRASVYIVDVMRKNGVIWGVGRGSSVASFVLYLIGITKINPMDYDLEIGEFLSLPNP